LHQSARDGFRSYLQAYASYSLKKIFDINALDLAKVGKAFGFAVPPRVNVNIGGGKSTDGPVKKRRRIEVDEDDEQWEDMPLGGGAESDGDIEAAEEQDSQRNKHQRKEKGRRIETLGKKAVDKEMYRKGKERKRAKASGQQWSG